METITEKQHYATEPGSNSYVQSTLSASLRKKRTEVQIKRIRDNEDLLKAKKNVSQKDLIW